jgi:hypothetical protein
VSLEHGLKNIELERLKISQIDKLNDPFELSSLSFTDYRIRRAFAQIKEDKAKTQGILCLSKSWSNPLMWAHYADKHQGMCLGFDVREEKWFPVSYRAKRFSKLAKSILAKRSSDEEEMLRIFTTKSSHWSYEREVRAFAALNSKDEKTGFFFHDFGPDLKLVQVIAGCRSEVTYDKINEKLGSTNRAVEIFRAKLSHNKFALGKELLSAGGSHTSPPLINSK